MSNPALVYKIVTAASFAPMRNAATYAGMPIDVKDGYIHFSTAAQLPETLRLHFRGQSDLLLLALRAADLGDGLVYEPSRGGELFPHYYGGPLPLAALAWEEPISVDADGACLLPEAVR